MLLSCSFPYFRGSLQHAGGCVCVARAVLSPISGDHYSDTKDICSRLHAVLSPISGDHYSQVAAEIDETKLFFPLFQGTITAPHLGGGSRIRLFFPLFQGIITARHHPKPRIFCCSFPYCRGPLQLTTAEYCLSVAVLSPISGDHYSISEPVKITFKAVLSPISGDHYSGSLGTTQTFQAVLSPIAGDHYS